MRAIIFGLLFFRLLSAETGAAKGTEILWDRYGVPHIFARDRGSAFFALGYSQMQSHANLLLELYGEARGRAAEYWGEKYLENDFYLRTVNAPARAKQWQSQQSPEFRGYLDSFAAGINAYAQEHPEQISAEMKRVLPVTGLDPLLHAERVMYYVYIAPPRRVGFTVEPQPQGSNAWAIAPSHSTDGHAMLLANPHQTWSGAMLFWEAHIVTPGLNLYGAMQIGFPVMRYAFNDYLGFCQTVNTIDVADVYRLTLKDSGYLYDGAVRPFETEKAAVQVRRGDGSLASRTFTIRHAIQGPVVQMQQGTGLALRVAGLDRPGLLAQYWAMDTAQNFQQFQSALAQHQVPMFTVMYADREGHIMHLYNGLLPQRGTGDYAFWQGTVPGDTSATMWTQIHPLRDMPRVVDPPTGWLQNTNDPPWSTTFPMVLNPADFPAYMAPQTLSLRTSRSVRMLTEHPKLSLDDLIQLKHSTRAELADHILDDVLAEAKRSGSERAKRAAQVLAAWDRQVNADSGGAMLFELFGTRLMQSAPYTTPPDLRAPLTTPKGLRSPAQAVELLDQAAGELEAAFGRLDIPWGEVHRFRLGGVDLPANGASGALGVFRAITYLPTSDHRMAASFGDSYVAAVEFGNPVRAKVLLSYGNSSQPGSKHIGDQLPLLARKELRTAWRTRKEIEANLEERKLF